MSTIVAVADFISPLCSCPRVGIDYLTDRRAGLVSGQPKKAVLVGKAAETYEQGSTTRLIEHRIFNAGQSCVVKSDQLDPKGPFTIAAGDTGTAQRVAQPRPKVGQTDGHSLSKTLIPLDVEP